MPAAMSMASTGPLDLVRCPPAGPPPRSQGPGPSQVDRTMSCNGPCDDQLGLYAPSYEVPYGVMPRLHSLSGGSTSGLCLPLCGGASGHSSLCLHGSASGLRSPFCGSASGGGSSASCLPSRGKLSTLCLAVLCSVAPRSRLRSGGSTLAQFAHAPSLWHLDFMVGLTL